MTLLSLSRAWRPVALGLLVSAALAGPALANGGLLAAAPADGLFNPKVPPADVGDGRILVAQSKQEAQLISRIQDLEEQVRTLTGQIEGLQFQLTQMQQLIDRMTQDNEYRFEQLEGTAPKSPPGQAPSGSAPAPATSNGASGDQGALPAAPQTPPQTDQQEQTGSIQQLPPLATDNDVASADGQPMDSDEAPLDLSLGDSQDPLLKGGSTTLGTLDQDALPQSGDVASRATSADAKAQYQAGYDAMTRGDYDFAEDQFSQFVALYPNDPEAPDATNWLGEAMIQQGAYTDAAQVLADGYTKYKDSKRAPDMLLKLGIALSGADQRDVACRTFFTLSKRYPNLAPAFRTRLSEENQKAQCPPIS